MSVQERRSFRAETLEDALRLVSEELGPEALVVRQREGVIGGVGGFFGRRCVELEVELPAQPASPSEAVAAARPRPPAAPRRALIDRYDTGPSARDVAFTPFVPDELVAAEAEPAWLEPEAPVRAAEPESSFDWIEPETPVRPAVPETAHVVAEPEPEAEPEAVAALAEEPAAAEPEGAPVPETPLLAETPDAAEQESAAEITAVSALPAVPEEPAPEPSASLVVAAAPEEPEPELAEPEDEGPLVRRLFDQAAPFADKISETLERTSIGRRLADAGMNSRLAREVVHEAETELRVFDPLQPFEDQVRTALARRIKVARSARKKRRVIALVGPPGAGKTLTAARLCHVYGGDARHPVAALSLQSVREAFRLAEHMRSLDVRLAAAEEARVLEVELEKLEGAELLIVDTPGVEPADEDRLRTLGCLLELVGADETHLLVPASDDAGRVRSLVEAFSSTLGANRILITHLDGPGGATAAVSASIDARLPISFTATGASWGLRPADPQHLAELVVG